MTAKSDFPATASSAITGASHSLRRMRWLGMVVGILLLLVLAFLMLYRLNVSPAPHFDEGAFLKVANNYALHGIYADYSADGNRYTGAVVSSGPTLILPIALVFKLFGASIVLGRLVSVAYSVLLLVALYGVASALIDRRLAIAAIALMIIAPNLNFIEYSSRTVLGEVPGMFYLMLGTLLWFVAAKRGFWYRVAAGVSFGLACITKNQYALIILPGLAASLVLDRVWYRRRGWLYYIIPGVIATAIYAGWTYYAFFQLGAADRNVAYDFAQFQAMSKSSILLLHSVTLNNNFSLLLSDPLLVPAILLAAFHLFNRQDESEQNWSVLLIFFMLAAFLFVTSDGWTRYLIYPVGLGVLLETRLLYALTKGFRLAWGRDRRRAARQAGRLPADHLRSDRRDSGQHGAAPLLHAGQRRFGWGQRRRVSGRQLSGRERSARSGHLDVGNGSCHRHRSSVQYAALFGLRAVPDLAERRRASIRFVRVLGARRLALHPDWTSSPELGALHTRPAHRLQPRVFNRRLRSVSAEIALASQHWRRFLNRHTMRSFRVNAGVICAAASTLVLALLFHPAAAHGFTWVDFEGSNSPFSAQNCDSSANPIVAENCQPGSTDWMTQNDLGDIEGFAFRPSANIGETVNFYVHTSAPSFDLQIYRSGYYGGDGARLVDEIDSIPSQTQPACNQDFGIGIVSCSNWSVTYSLQIPTDWVSGIYFAKLIRRDTSGTGFMLFVVRDDDRPSTILYQQSTATYQAYNDYLGPSVYDKSDPGASGACTRISGTDRAVKVSLMRPYARDFFSFDNLYTHTEYPLVRWLEQQGYDVTYTTSFDTDTSGTAGNTNQLLNHKAFLSSGHDEYWTEAIRTAITQARDAGVNLGFFSANTGYWRIRMEDDPYTGTPDSVMVTYKTTQEGPPDPSGIPTGTWRDPAGSNQPESALLGGQYVGDNDALNFQIRVSSDEGKNPVFRHTDLQSLPDGSAAIISEPIIGWEWDAVTDASPANIEILASSAVYGFLLTDAGDFNIGKSGAFAANMTHYTASSGAQVYDTGMILWSWGLGANGMEVVPVDPYVQQITYNMLSDMSAQPATPASDLILDGDTEKQVTGADIFSPDEAPNPVITAMDTQVDGTEVHFSWTTDVETRSQIWHGADSTHLISYWEVEPSGYSTEHSYTQTLQPDETRYYQIAAFDHRGQMVTSDVQSVHIDPGSIVTQIRNKLALGNLPTTLRCSLLERPTQTIALGVVGVVVVVGVIGGVGVTLFRRRRA